MGRALRARAVARPLVALASAPSSADAPAVEAPPASDAPLDFTDGPVLGGGAAGADAAGDEAAPRAAPVARPVRPAAANLARRPEPPALDEALQRRYPDEARVAGRAGAATVRVRISRDGRASVLAVASASEPAFGEACRATVEA